MKGKTARLTNSFNGVSLKAFNSWGGVNYDDVLATYKEETVEKVWEAFCRFVIQNYQNGKGTSVKGLGVFTYTNAEYSLEGTTNQYDRDKKTKRPVFIVSGEFLEDLRPGQYNKGSGLIYYTQKINNSIGLTKMNYAELAYSLTISKEEYFTIFTALIKQMVDNIRMGEFREKRLPGVGVFMLKGNVFGVKFNEDIYEEVKHVPQKNILTKRNIGLFMETSQSGGVRQQDIRDIDKAIREVRPSTSVITQISQSGQKWLKQKMDINLDSLEPDQVPLIEQPYQSMRYKTSKDFFLNQKPFRETPIQNLYGLSIPNDILEAIASHKDMLLKAMKEYDRHNNTVIPKFELLQAIRKANVHHRLTIETINKIVSLYAKNLAQIDYTVFLNCLLKDINLILRRENANFPIDHYKIGQEGKRTISSYSFNRSCGNLSMQALSSIDNYRTIQVDQSEVQSDIEKIQACLPSILHLSPSRLNTCISFIELILILNPYSISLSKDQMIKVLKYLNIPNPNAFNFSSFASAIKAKSFTVSSNEITKKEITDCISRIKSLLVSLGGEDYLFKGARSISYEKFSALIAQKASGISSKLLMAAFNYITSNKRSLTNEHYARFLQSPKQRFDDNYIIEAISIIVDKYSSMKMKPDQYFDHLLSYNICRNQNTITLQELERLFQLEKLPFNSEETAFIYNYINFKREEALDREQWNQTMRKVHHPLLTMQNYIRKEKLQIEDVLYKMELDLQKSIFLDRNAFKMRMKLINDSFDNQWIYSLFNEINSKGAESISVQQIADAFNVFKKEPIESSDINSNRHSFEGLINHLQSICDFSSLKRDFMAYDRTVKGRIPKELFLSVLQSKTTQYKDDLLKLIRCYKLLDGNDDVRYPEFCEIVYETATKDNFSKCLAVLKHFLNEDCNNDLFLFFVKMNNMANSSSMQKWLSIEKVYEFFRNKVDFLQLETVTHFDVDQDGIVSFEDMKTIIKRFISPTFFDKKKPEVNQEKITEEKFKQIVNDIKAAIKKRNMTEVNLFQFLDDDHDGYITYEEYSNQIDCIISIPKEKKDAFFDYLDYFHHGYINIEVFLKRIKLFMSKDFYVGNNVIETVALSELAKWYNRNLSLSDTEVFSELDHDSDGVISVADMKHFVLNSLNLSKHEVRDSKIQRVMQAISLTNGNITLNDIRHFMSKAKSNALGEYFVKITELCNLGVKADNVKQNPDWIKEVIAKLGLFISEHYSSIAHFYEENQSKSHSFKADQLKKFLEKHPSALEGFEMGKDQINALFAFLDTSNKKHLTIEDFEKQLNGHDFYKKMDEDIKAFIKLNFFSAMDAFKYFNNSSSPNVTSISHKELFNGLNYLFPSKYSTETLLAYIRKTFPTTIQEIPYSKFNYVYFEDIRFDQTFPQERWRTTSKIVTSREREDLPTKPFSIRPFSAKDHEPLQTPFDVDPLNKLKRIIASAKVDFASFFNMNIMLSDHGFVNQFEFRNLIKKLDLGLTNIEIEDIIARVGKSRDGRINLREFQKYILSEDHNLKISKEHILAVLKQIKTLIYKYYSTPKFAFELNDMKATQAIDFEKFKKIVYDLYTKNSLEVPNYAMLKYVYDYIDIRKDGVIHLNEWNKIFAMTEGALDVKGNPKQMRILREWETSNDIDDIFKAIARNKKIIREKAKLYFMGQGRASYMLMDNLIMVLKDILSKVRLSHTQWRMLVAAGDKEKNGFIDFDTFISLIEASTNRRPQFSNRK